MSLREYIQTLEMQNRLIKVTAPISKIHEIAAVLKKTEPAPVLFERVKESDFRVVGTAEVSNGKR